MTEFARHHPTLVYVLLTYALSWAYWIPLALSGEVVTPGDFLSEVKGIVMSSGEF